MPKVVKAEARKWFGCSRSCFLFQHPGVLAAAALAAVDDQASLAQGDAGQAAGHDDDFFAVENVRAKIDAAAFETVLDEAGMLAQLDDRLGDEIARIVFDFSAKSSRSALLA